MGLDLAELVHELELMHPDVAAPIPRRKVLPVRRDPDAPHTVSLVVQRVLWEYLDLTYSFQEKGNVTSTETWHENITHRNPAKM